MCSTTQHNCLTESTPCDYDAKVRSILRDATTEHVAAVIDAFLGMLGVNTESRDDVIKLQGISMFHKRMCIAKKKFRFFFLQEDFF